MLLDVKKKTTVPKFRLRNVCQRLSSRSADIGSLSHPPSRRPLAEGQLHCWLLFDSNINKSCY